MPCEDLLVCPPRGSGIMVAFCVAALQKVDVSRDVSRERPQVGKEGGTDRVDTIIVDPSVREVLSKVYAERYGLTLCFFSPQKTSEMCPIIACFHNSTGCRGVLVARRVDLLSRSGQMTSSLEFETP